jgi:hypothetical protein
VNFYIPLTETRGEKKSEVDKRVVLKDWSWAQPVYSTTLTNLSAPVIKIEIDPTKRMADIDRTNNVFE